MSRLSRRSLIGKSLLAAGTTALLSARQSKGVSGLQRALGRPLGANDRIRVAVAGIHNQGSAHIKYYSQLAKSHNVEIVYLVDPDSRLFESRVKIVEDQAGYRPAKCVQDVRQALDDRDVDAVSIATPNHWHSLITIWACQAGKDVLVEKPMSHNMHEGRIVVETARKYGRVVRHGIQNRDSTPYNQMISVVRSGKLGKLKVARGLCYKPGWGEQNTRGSIGYAPYKRPPAELDFDMWLGPAPRQPYHENLVHYRWHWFWDFGNGDTGNQGINELDIVRWAIPNSTLPGSVISFGGRLGYHDQGETPSTLVTIADYGETKLIFETRGLKSDPYFDLQIGVILHLDGGTIACDFEKILFYPKGSSETAPLPEVPVEMGSVEGEGEIRKFTNFLAVMRSRKIADLRGDALDAHHSCALVHLANASFRLGGKVPFRPQPEELNGDADVREVLDRTEQHLATHGISLEKDGYVLGRKLVVDPMSEMVVDDPQADALLTRHYRRPFVVPDRV